MFPTANYVIHLKQQKADVKKKSPFLRYWPQNEMRQGADEGEGMYPVPAPVLRGKQSAFSELISDNNRDSRTHQGGIIVNICNPMTQCVSIMN